MPPLDLRDRLALAILARADRLPPLSLGRIALVCVAVVVGGAGRWQ